MYAAFAHALLRPDAPLPEGVSVRAGVDPVTRYAVHRNNVMVSLVDALADTYPVVQALVGEDFFRALAREFARRHPPASPVLAWYGEAFPDFIDDFAPTADLPWLPDVARLEWLRLSALQAADAEPLAHDALSALLTTPDTLPTRHLHLHPAVRVFRSDYAAVSVWAAHQHDTPDATDTTDTIAAALADVTLNEPQAALLVRPALALTMLPIATGDAAFVHALQAGECLGAAAEQAQTVTPTLDLANILALLVREGALTGFV